MKTEAPNGGASPKTKKNNWLVQGAGLIAFIVAYGVVRSLLSPSPSSSSLSSALVDASNQINQTTPQTIDSATELTSASASGSELDYHYTVTTLTQLTQADLDNSLKSNLVQEVCATDATKSLINMGATLGYNYYDSQGAFIGKLAVSSADCN